MIRTIMLHIDYDELPERRILLAASLARRFGAKLIGFCAGTYLPVFLPQGYGYRVAAMVEQDRRVIEQRLAQRGEEFRRIAGDGVVTEWRPSYGLPAPALAREARAADLVVVGSGAAADGLRSLNPADFVLNSGRPVFVAADGRTELDAEAVLVAWKDCREARRAVKDALPFLIAAARVRVVTIDEEKNGPASEAAGAEDCAAYLRGHGANAESARRPVGDGGAGHALLLEAKALGADMIVSGAYGHSKLREWIFGGVTRTLLGSDNIHRLLSN